MLKHRPIMLKKAIHRLIVKRKRMIAKRLTGNIAKIEGIASFPARFASSSFSNARRSIRLEYRISIISFGAARSIHQCGRAQRMEPRSLSLVFAA